MGIGKNHGAAKGHAMPGRCGEKNHPEYYYRSVPFPIPRIYYSIGMELGIGKFEKNSGVGKHW